jgi:hypothetical protein
VIQQLKQNHTAICNHGVKAIENAGGVVGECSVQAPGEVISSTEDRESAAREVHGVPCHESVKEGAARANKPRSSRGKHGGSAQDPNKGAVLSEGETPKQEAVRSNRIQNVRAAHVDFIEVPLMHV